MSTIATSLVTDHEVARHRLTLASVGDDGDEDVPCRGVSPVGGRAPGVESACVGARGGVRSGGGRSGVSKVPSGSGGSRQHDVWPTQRRSWASVRQRLRAV